MTSTKAITTHKITLINKQIKSDLANVSVNYHEGWLYLDGNESTMLLPGI